MDGLLALSRAIDRLTDWLGRWVAWLVVAAILVSAGNAVIRKLFDSSSNAWLELQWWMFGAVFLLAAPWTLRVNEHIRIDIVSSRFTPRTRTLVDIVGHALFLVPLTLVVIVTSWPFFVRSFALNEQSANAGGLPSWPAKFLIPLAFALLLAQGLSELVKRIAALRGIGDPPPAPPHHPAIDMHAAPPTAEKR